jgi:hypothetical protein
MTYSTIDLSGMTRREVQALVNECIAEAKRDLGDDLCGFAVTDLVADNFPTLSLKAIADLLDLPQDR